MSREQLCTKVQEQATLIRNLKTNLEKSERELRKLLQIENIAKNGQHIIGMILDFFGR